MRDSGDGASRTRTGGLLGAIQALSQLSYSPGRIHGSGAAATPNRRCKAVSGAHSPLAFGRGVRRMRLSSRLGRFLAAFVLAPDARLPVALVTAGVVLLALCADLVLSHAVNRRIATFVEGMRRLSHG